MARIGFTVVWCVSAWAASGRAQNRGVYPLGMSATNSGVTPPRGLTYANQLLFYSRDEAKDGDGHTVATGDNDVLMDMNTFTWVSPWTVLGGARYSASATFPFAVNSLDSDAGGPISGGGGFADSYYIPIILGWSGEKAGVRAMYGFLAPTGRFVAGANDNVGSGYWTHTLSSGQTFYLRGDKRLILSAFEMYELHTTQEDTDIHPGDTFDLDYSLMVALPNPKSVPLQVGVVGYEARQTTAKTGPAISGAATEERYAVNAIGGAALASFPKQKAGLGAKYFQEFSNRSTYEGFSAQIFGSIRF